MFSAKAFHQELSETKKLQGFWASTVPQNTIQKSISIGFCVSAIRHDSSLSKYRKQKHPPWKYSKWHMSRGVTAAVYGTC
jgi:hypothetical protein